MAGGIEVLEMSEQARVGEVAMLNDWWSYQMPPGGGGGGFPPIDDEKRYGGGRPEPGDSPELSFLRKIFLVTKWILKPGHLPEVAFPSGHAVPDPTGTVPGGFRLHETSDQHSHQWDVASGSMPNSWLESSPRRLG